MQTLWLPAASPCRPATLPTPIPYEHRQRTLRVLDSLDPLTQSLKRSISIPHCTLQPFFSTSTLLGINGERVRENVSSLKGYASSHGSHVAPTAPSEELEKAKLAQVAKRLESTSRHFKRLGTFGFWAQLICSVVAAGILSFSTAITGKISSAVTFYSTAGGLVAAFISVFWSFGYIRLAEQLRRTANDPSKAPPRADVVQSLRNGIVLNLLGMGAAVLGLQATVGLLVAKSLTSSVNPFYQGVPPGYSPVLALDVFLVQASANTLLSHFLGLASSLELLRSVTLPPSESIPSPKIA